MTETDDTIHAFNVTYYDEWLDVEDFTTIKAEDEEDAKVIWESEHKRDDRQMVQDITLSFTLNKTKMERLFDEVPEITI